MEQNEALSKAFTSFTILLLISGSVLNLGALAVFCDVPKLLKSTINTLVRNLFVAHLVTILVTGPLLTVKCEPSARKSYDLPPIDRTWCLLRGRFEKSDVSLSCSHH